jgi:glycolate oxidase FAD binding subunit
VIRPEPGELQELVQDLHRQGTPWLPAGLGSRLDWGAPLAPCTVVSCGALRGIREHSPGDFTITVGAGTPLEELQEALAPHRQWLALDPPFEAGPLTALTPGTSQPTNPRPNQGSIGGLVARGLAGGYRERYLGVRDQIIGLRLLRADGVEAMAGGKVVKNVAGYDLMRLLCGSWGSLGLITELTLRTLPVPPQRRGLLLSGSLEELMAAVARLLRSGLTPERLDLWSPALAAAAGQAPSPLLLVGLASVNDASLDAQVEGLAESLGGAGGGGGAVGGGGVVKTGDVAAALAMRCCSAAELATLLSWGRGGRLGASPTAATTTSAGEPRTSTGASATPPTEPVPDPANTPDPAAWLLRLGVTPSRGGELLAHPALADLPVNLSAGSGLALAWARAGFPAEQVRELRHHCQALGGHLTVLRQPDAPDPATALPAWEDAPSRPMIEAIKARFDPKGQLAPGRLPGVARPSLGPRSC